MAKKKKKGGEEAKKNNDQKRLGKGNVDHKARGKDPVQVLKSILKSSGLKEAELEAQELDRVGLNGTQTLEKLKTMHQEGRPGGGLVWVDGPAKWMRDVLAVAERKDAEGYVPTEKQVGRAVRNRKAERAAAEAVKAGEVSDTLTELQVALSEAGSQE